MKQVLEHPVKNQAANTKKNDYLTIVSCLLVACYITSNVMAVKIINVFGITLFDAGTITFPFAYMLGDILTEVWGFKKARKVIFLTFICNAFFVAFTYIGGFLPFPQDNAELAGAYSMVFNYVPRIILASFAAFLTGELSNAYFLEKIKAWTKGKHLWIRTIGSSAIGHAIDTVVFTMIAFYGEMPIGDLLSMILYLYIAKFLIEAIAGTPLAYLAIAKIKKKIDVI